MEIVVFAYQVIPGRDEMLRFAKTLEACQNDAIAQRDEIRRDDPGLEQLGAMAIYQMTFRNLDATAMIAVLNEELALLDAAVIDRRLVAVVAE